MRDELWSTTTVDGEQCVIITWTIMTLKFSVGCLVFLVVQLYKTSENNIYEGLMLSTTTVDEELCVMIIWTTMMLKLSVGCLVLQAVQLYRTLNLGEQYYQKTC